MLQPTPAPAARPQTTLGLGDLIASVYQEFLAIYGDPELASVAAAAVINDLLIAQGDTDRVAVSA